MSRGFPIAVVAGALLLAVACGGAENGDGSAQRTFESPEQAAETVFDALERDDADAVLAIFGRQHGEPLVSEWEAERDVRQAIASAGREALRVARSDARVELILGTQEWPFPFPLLEEEEGWRFDTEEGIQVVLDRQIGRNELSTIAIVHAYVDAQLEYVLDDHDGEEVLEFAQQLVSDPGEKNGLYWEAGPGEPESPFGPLVRGAELLDGTREPGDPLHGYYFRILDEQGPNAPGGAHDYVVDGNMILGFALVAFPSDYGHSGIMTFVVSHRGEVYQKDLDGRSDVTSYDPDDSWTEVADLPGGSGAL